MKKLTATILAVILILSSVFYITACGGETETPGGETLLTGTLTEILSDITQRSGAELPASMEDSLTAENCTYSIGLSAEDFEKYVSEGIVSNAMINVNAHQIILLKLKDAKDATDVKQLITEKYDSFKWVCVMPDKSIVIESGEYILLAVSTADTANALIDAFKAAAGEHVGNAVTFFDKEKLTEEDFSG